MGNICSGSDDQKSEKETTKVYTQIERHEYNDYDSCNSTVSTPYSSSQLSDKAKSILDDIRNDEQLQSFQTQHKLEISTVRDIPLNQFSVDDVCGTLLKWIYNDINYNAQLEKTKIIFLTHELYGQKLKY
eukprot:376768_1